MLASRTGNVLLYLLYVLFLLMQFIVVDSRKVSPPCLKGAMMCGFKVNQELDSSSSSNSASGSSSTMRITKESSNDDFVLVLFGGLTTDETSTYDTWILRDSLSNLTSIANNNLESISEYEQNKWKKINTLKYDPHPRERWKGSLSCFSQNAEASSNESLRKQAVAALFGGASPKRDGSYKESYFNDLWLLFALKVNSSSSSKNNGYQYEYKWKLMNPEENTLRPSGRKAHSAIVYGIGKVVIFGGRDENGNLLDDTWLFDINTRTYEKVKDSKFPGTPREDHLAVVHGDYMYVYGGFDGVRFCDDMFKFHLQTSTWSEVEYAKLYSDNRLNSPSPRDHAIAEVVGEYMFLFGGRDLEDTYDKLDELWKFHFETSKWEEVLPRDKESWPLGRIDASSGVIFGDKKSEFIVIFGGEDVSENSKNDMWLFDPIKGVWHQVYPGKCEHSISSSIVIFTVLVFMSFMISFLYFLRERELAIQSNARVAP